MPGMERSITTSIEARRSVSASGGLAAPGVAHHGRAMLASTLRSPALNKPWP